MIFFAVVEGVCASYIFSLCVYKGFVHLLFNKEYDNTTHTSAKVYVCLKSKQNKKFDFFCDFCTCAKAIISCTCEGDRG